MPRPSIEYLNARRALKPASGGAVQSRAVKYAPVSELDQFEIIRAKLDAFFADQRSIVREYRNTLRAGNVDEISF